MNHIEQIDQLVRHAVIPISGLLSLLMPANSRVGFGIKRLDGRYRLANQAIEQLLCQGTGRLAGRSEGDLLPADRFERLAHCDQLIIDGAPAACVEINLPASGEQGRPYLWLKLPVLGTDQRLQSIASVIHEISSPQASSALHQTLDRLQQINQQLQRTVIELEQVASTDKLTGARNRRRLEECARKEMDRLHRYGQPLSMILIDIDFFKAINDHNGHHAGDQVLQALAVLLQGRLRGSDSLARWGGEEFVILCSDTQRASAAILAERLRQQVAAETFMAIGQLTVSMGVAECRPGESWEEWFERADQALYRAKSAGRNQVQVAAQATTAESMKDYVIGSFVQLVWHSAYECGDELVDRGHRLLFADANELLSAILSGQAAASVDEIIDRLLADVLQHFNDEESVILAAGFPGTAEHVLLHRQLVLQGLTLVDAYRTGKQGVGDVFQFLAYEVVTKHMLGADREFFPCLRAQASSAIRQGAGVEATTPPQRADQSAPATPGDLVCEA